MDRVGFVLVFVGSGFGVFCRDWIGFLLGSNLLSVGVGFGLVFVGFGLGIFCRDWILFRFLM